MRKYGPRPRASLLRRNQGHLPLPILGTETPHQIFAKSPCATPHRVHWTKVARLEGEMAKQSRLPHARLFHPIFHAYLPPHGVSSGRMGKEQNR